MNYKVYKIDITQNFKNIAEIESIKGLEWQDDIDQVFMSFSFTSPTVLECGDKIKLYNTVDEKDVWYGVITTVNQTRTGEYNYSGYDAGFYLHKNELTTQYDENTFEYILKDVCKQCKLKIGNFPDLNDVKYTHLYRKETAEKILRDTYKNLIKNGIKDIYYFDCKNGKINLKQFSASDELKGSISLLGKIDTFKFIKGFNISNSIVDTKNYVKIFTNESVNKKNTDKPDGEYKNDESIEKYGFLNYTEDLDKDSKEKPNKVAKDIIDKLSGAKNTIELTVWSDYKLQTGAITTINEEKIKLKETYRVLSSKHKINEIDEEVTITVEKHESK